jgi:hypothetical protein
MTERTQDDVIDYEDFEDFDQEDFLDEEDTEELDFETDEKYRGDPEGDDV